MRDRRDQIIGRLVAELEEAKEHNRQLLEELSPKGWFCPVEFGLTRAERLILSALVMRDRCSQDFLHRISARDGANPDTDVKIVHVWMARMRPKLRRFGIEIVTLWGSNDYALRPADRHRLKHWSDPPADACWEALLSGAA